MSYNALTAGEIQVKQPISQPLMQKLKDNFDYLYGAIAAAQGGAAGVPNGSFEIDSDANGIPDTWTRNLFAGGSGSYETTIPQCGASAYKFVHPGGAGNGGGYLDSDYVEVTKLNGFSCGITLWSTVAGMRNKVQALFYDKGKVHISDVDLYNSVSNPTSPTRFCFQCLQASIPANSCFVKFRLVGGDSATNVAGTTYFDNVTFDPLIWNQRLKMSQGSWSSAVNFTGHISLPQYMFGSPNFYTFGNGSISQCFVGIGSAGASGRVMYVSMTTGGDAVTITWDYISTA